LLEAVGGPGPAFEEAAVELIAEDIAEFINGATWQVSLIPEEDVESK